MKTDNRRARRFRSARAVGMTFFGAIGTVVVAASTAWACTVFAAAYLFVVPPGGPDFLVTEGNRIAAIDPLANDPIGPVDLDQENYTGEAGAPIAVVGFCGGGAGTCDGRLGPLGYAPENQGVIATGGLYMAAHASAPEHYLFVDSGVPIRDPNDALGTKTEAGDVTSMQTDCSRSSRRIGQVVYNATEIDAPVVQDGKSPLTVVAGEGQIPSTFGNDHETGGLLETGKYVICADPLPAHIWNFYTVVL